MKKDHFVYLVFTYTGTSCSRLLRAVTGQVYTHVSISFDPSLETCYSFGRYSVRDMLWKGTFVVEGKDRGIYREKRGTCAKVFEVPVTKEQFVRAQQVVAEFVLQKQIFRYNYMGLVPLWLGIPMERRTKFVCSQFVAYVLEKGGIADFPGGYSTARPVDLHGVGRRVVFEGALCAYREHN